MRCGCSIDEIVHKHCGRMDNAYMVGMLTIVFRTYTFVYGYSLSFIKINTTNMNKLNTIIQLNYLFQRWSKGIQINNLDLSSSYRQYDDYCCFVVNNDFNIVNNTNDNNRNNMYSYSPISHIIVCR